MAAFAELRPQIGIAPACVALSINRAGIYRARGRLPRQRCGFGGRTAAFAALLVAVVALADEPRVQFQVLAGLELRLSKPIYTAINSQDELMTFWKIHSEDLLGETSPVKTNKVPTIDFHNDTLLVASAGIKGNSGYALAITSVRDLNAAIIVSVLEIAPGTSCPTAQEISNPRTFALVPKTDKHVKFIVSHAIVDCHTRETYR